MQGQMRNLRESVRTAFNTTQQQQQQTARQPQNSTPFEAPPRAAFPKMPSVSNTTPIEQPSVRNAQLEAFLNSNNMLNDADDQDMDRFSIASSSSESVIEPPKVPVLKNKAKSKSANLNKKQMNQRTLVI